MYCNTCTISKCTELSNSYYLHQRPTSSAQRRAIFHTAKETTASARTLTPRPIISATILVEKSGDCLSGLIGLWILRPMISDGHILLTIHRRPITVLISSSVHPTSSLSYGDFQCPPIRLYHRTSSSTSSHYHINNIRMHE